MDSMKNKWKPAKKCDCKNAIPNKKRLRAAQFIKFRDERGNILQRAGKQGKCTSDSDCNSKNTSILEPAVVVFNKTDLPSLSSEIKMTARRKCYELTHQHNDILDDDVEEKPSFNISDGTLIDKFSEEMLNSLSQFRLKNATDCFAFLNIRTLHEKLMVYKNFVRPHTCEYSFYLNDTGILEPANKTLDGKAVCSICHKVLNDVESDNIPNYNNSNNNDNDSNLNTDTKQKVKKCNRITPKRNSQTKRVAWY